MSGTVKTRAQLEAMFGNGKRPTGQDFADLIASPFMPGEDAHVPHRMQLHIGSSVTATGGAAPDVAGYFIRPEWPGSTKATLICWASASFDVELLDSTDTTIWSGTCIHVSPQLTTLATVAGPNVEEVYKIGVVASPGLVVYVEALLLQFIL